MTSGRQFRPQHGSTSPELQALWITFPQSLSANLGSWPALRIIEGCATDSDPEVARVALRYLGLRGDVTSFRVPERALRDVDRSSIAIEAICDRGAQGLSGLTWAFWNTRHAGRIVEPISQLALRGRSSNWACFDWIGSALRGARGVDPGERGVALLALIESASTAPAGNSAGIEFLFELVANPGWKKIALDTLALLSQAGEYLAATLTDEGPQYPEGLRLDVTERLGWRAALPWLEEICLRGESPQRALEVLAGLDGVDVIDSLIYVRRDSAGALFAHAWHRAIEQDSDRFTEYSWRAVERGGKA